MFFRSFHQIVFRPLLNSILKPKTTTALQTWKESIYYSIAAKNTKTISVKNKWKSIESYLMIEMWYVCQIFILHRSNFRQLCFTDIILRKLAELRRVKLNSNNEISFLPLICWLKAAMVATLNSWCFKSCFHWWFCKREELLSCMVCFYTATTMKSRTRRRESAKNGCTSEMAYSKYSMCNLSEEKLHFLSNISSEKKRRKDRRRSNDTWSDWFLLAKAEVLIWLPVIIPSRGR